MMVDLPNNQNATHTLTSAPSNLPFIREQNLRQEKAGVPGMGTIASSSISSTHAASEVWIQSCSLCNEKHYRQKAVAHAHPIDEGLAFPLPAADMIQSRKTRIFCMWADAGMSAARGAKRQGSILDVRPVFVLLLFLDPLLVLRGWASCTGALLLAVMTWAFATSFNP